MKIFLKCQTWVNTYLEEITSSEQCASAGSAVPLACVKKQKIPLIRKSET